MAAEMLDPTIAFWWKELRMGLGRVTTMMVYDNGRDHSPLDIELIVAVGHCGWIVGLAGQALIVARWLLLAGGAPGSEDGESRA